jgi:hypothetical protein
MADGVAAVSVGVAFFTLFVVAAHVPVPCVRGSRRGGNTIDVRYVQRGVVGMSGGVAERPDGRSHNQRKRRHG